MAAKTKWPDKPEQLSEEQRLLLDEALVMNGGDADKSAKEVRIKPILLKVYLQTDAALKEAQRDGALQQCGGNVQDAATAVGIRRETLSRAISKSMRLKSAQIIGNENLLDLAESKVVKGIKKDDGAMIRFFLDRKGKNRGWSTKHEISAGDGQVLTVGKVHMYLPDNGRGDHKPDGD